MATANDAKKAHRNGSDSATIAQAGKAKPLRRELQRRRSNAAAVPRMWTSVRQSRKSYPADFGPQAARKKFQAGVEGPRERRQQCRKFATTGQGLRREVASAIARRQPGKRFPGEPGKARCCAVRQAGGR